MLLLVSIGRQHKQHLFYRNRKEINYPGYADASIHTYIDTHAHRHLYTHAHTLCYIHIHFYNIYICTQSSSSNTPVSSLQKSVAPLICPPAPAGAFSSPIPNLGSDCSCWRYLSHNWCFITLRSLALISAGSQPCFSFMRARIR